MTWIGWAFDFEHFVVQLDPAKLARLLALLRQLQSSPKCTVTVLEKLTGKLLWLSNLFSALRPSLAPLYLDQHNPVPNMCAISPDLWVSFRASLSPELRVVRPLPLAAIPVGCKLLRYSHTPVSALSDLLRSSSRRVWVRVANPLRPDLELSAESSEVLRMWTELAASPFPFRSLFLRPLFVCEAFADACADSSLAGLGGSVCQMAARHALHAPFPSPSLQICFFGSRLMPHRSIALPPGRCWSKWDFCGLCPSFFRPGMSPFT